MKQRTLLFGLCLTILMFVFAVPNAMAINNYTNDDETSTVSNYSVSTTYEAGTYVPPIEVYNVDLEWDDLHWIFIYSGDITNPTDKIWITKAQYETYRNGQDVNTFNLKILDNINQYKNHDEVQITVANHSAFAVDIEASIEQKSTVNYTNSSVLQVKSEQSSNWSSSSSSIEGLAHNSSSFFKIKPQSSRFVNDSGKTVSVTGEVKLTFSKS